MSDMAGDTGRDPLILAVTDRLTRLTASRLRHDVEAVDGDEHVVIDLTAIPGFDSEGAQALMDMQDEVGSDRLSIVGMRQATSRLMDLPAELDLAVVHATRGDVTITRLHNTAVIRSSPGSGVSGDKIESALSAALADDVAIVVVDVKDAGALDAAAVTAITFASSDAALSGRELLVVNLTASDAERLRNSGLSATTFVAPEVI